MHRMASNLGQRKREDTGKAISSDYIDYGWPEQPPEV